MEKTIIYSPEVKIYFIELIDVLFEKEYFGFSESAEEYVNKIREFIEQKIGFYPSKNTPLELLKFGEMYIRYESNSNTSWYIFYSQVEQTYFIKLISNNHSEYLAGLNLWFPIQNDNKPQKIRSVR